MLIMVDGVVEASPLLQQQAQIAMRGNMVRIDLQSAFVQHQSRVGIPLLIQHIGKVVGCIG